jgi:hypothetical protein
MIQRRLINAEKVAIKREEYFALKMFAVIYFSKLDMAGV